MFNFFVHKKRDKKDGDFSRFIRTASSKEKKKVFKRVLDKATEDQKRVIQKA